MEKQKEKGDLTNKSRDEKRKESIVREWNLGMHDLCLKLTKRCVFNQVVIG